MSTPSSRKGKGKSTDRSKGKEKVTGAPSQPTFEEWSQNEAYQRAVYESLQQQSQLQQSQLQQQAHFQQSMPNFQQTPMPFNNPITNFLQSPMGSFQRPYVPPRPAREDYREKEVVSDTEDEQENSGGPQFGPISEDEDVVEVVTKRKKAVKWSENEEFLLVQLFMDTSEDPKHGNNQTSGGFWGRVLIEWNKQTDRPEIERTNHQLSSKWNELKKKVGEFAEIYNNLKSTKGPSGTSEDDLMQETRREWSHKNNRRQFPYEKNFHFVRNHPKWIAQAPMNEHRPKRTRDSDFFATASPAFDSVSVDFDYPEPPRRKKSNSTASVNNTDETSDSFKEFVEFEKVSKSEYRQAKLKMYEKAKKRLTS